ncbi:DMT family transporter [uncultured Dialister sp.]|jgi:drug/metabolite transporter (DMT)-like permease|uniref:DMT family transporter n=1 Tax=uncultured Dialister sp. TaxID=278064 RepID=UPI0026067550|nr:DMT family transporter [uncultured Dialister sp.]
MKYRLLLLSAALIWGFAFVAQVVGMDTVGPFTFNGVRFVIGSLALLPFLYFHREEKSPVSTSIPLWAAFLMVGIPLFLGATLQQVGLQYTTASKASFLTANYLLMVPIAGLFLGQPLLRNHLIGAILAMTGVYFISITEDLTISYGDGLMLICAMAFTLQIHMLNYLIQRFSPVLLSAGQFMVTGLLNLLLAFLFETPTLAGLQGAAWPILYTGILSTSVAYTLQAVGQKYMPPTEASMILSMEMVFGGISGILFLDESFTLRQTIGVIAMTCGVFLSQIPSPVLLAGFHRKNRQS